MPVTARLSLKFYERLGEDLANELVDWFNQVDATYRSDLRDLNELNFARFDAKVEQRFAESEARFEKRIAESEVRFEKRIAETEVRFEKRLAESEVRFEKRLGELAGQVAEMDARWERRMADFQAEVLRDLRETKADLIKWSFVFVAGATLSILGVLLTSLPR